MSYVSLARKYRPRRFVDMVGQESTTLALTNAIRLRREPHSVIFTGVRGIGKTTSARIYAKALNCENGPTADPCDSCPSCMAIVAGNHEDVLEIDGASNTGVDDVRALQETLSYVPQRSTYKIYIIDEVHMLSISAFNALLKTLEEPPQHVVFIFATTELHKVPETIQSRCQTFHLQKISRPVIAERVRSILTAEGIPFDEAALAIVAREGRGSMRDALTMLDQAIAVGGGQVSMEALKNMVGSSQALPVLELLDGLLRKDAGQILEVIARWDQEGLAMSTLVEETAKACRNAFILRDLKGQAIDLQLLELEDREQQMLLELGEKAAPMDLNRLFRQLAKCLDDLRHADLDRFVLENYCLEWCFDPGLPDLQNLMNLISGGQPIPQSAPRSSSQAQPPAEGPPINLRERLKGAAPSPSTGRLAQTPPTSVEQPNLNPGTPAPNVKPGPALMGKSTSSQARFEKPSPSSGTGGITQAAMIQPTAPVQSPSGPQGSGASSTLAQKISLSSPATAPLAKPLSSAAVSTLLNSPPEPVQALTNMQSSPSVELMSAQAAAPALRHLQSHTSTPAQAVDKSPLQPGQVAQSVNDPAQSKGPPPENSAVRKESPLPAATVRTGAIMQAPVASRPGEPVLSPFDQSDDETPSWVLQEEESRQGAMAAPQDEPIASVPPKNEGFLKQMARKAAETPPVAPAKIENQPSPEPAPAAVHQPLWPENWRAFVDEWKKQKPLQGRVLEEAYVLEYSQQKIRLAVEPSSMAGGKLLLQDVRKRLMEQFSQLFGFQGVLEAVPKADAHPGKSGKDSPPPDLGETLLEVKHKERELAREQLRHRLEVHPMTREVISRFGGTIEQIELQ